MRYIYRWMDVLWARKSDIEAQKLIFVNTNNFPDSLFTLNDGMILISKDLGQTFSKNLTP